MFLFEIVFKKFLTLFCFLFPFYKIDKTHICLYKYFLLNIFRFSDFTSTTYILILFIEIHEIFQVFRTFMRGVIESSVVTLTLFVMDVFVNSERYGYGTSGFVYLLNNLFSRETL